MSVQLQLPNQGQSQDPGRDRYDPFFGTDANECYIGRVGQDDISGLGGNDTIEGARGDDTLRGGSGNDSLLGQDDNDSLIGGNGNDTLLGGNQNDTLEGGAGADSLDGGEDEDELFGGAGSDTLLGNNGSDELTGGTGNDVMEGGEGNDRYFFATGDGFDTVDDFSGTNTLSFSAGSALLFRDPGNGDLVIEHGPNSTDRVTVKNFYSQNLEARTVVQVGGETVAVNIAPTNLRLNNTAIAEVADPGALVGTIMADDPDSGPLTFAIESDPAGIFTIAGGNQLRTTGALDFETTPSYQVQLSATDPAGGFVIETFTIAVININEAPFGLSLASRPVPETAPLFFEVGTINALDPEGDPLTFRIEGDFGDAFGISGDKIVVTGDLDAQANPSYEVTIVATDRQFNTTSAEFTLTVTDVDQPPTDLDLSAIELEDGDPAGTFVGSLSAVDPDGTPVTFALLDDAGGQFRLEGANLVLADSIDFADGAERSVTVEARDGTGNAISSVFTVAVAEGDTMTGGSGGDNLPPADLALDDVLVPTSGAIGDVVGRLSARDPEGGTVDFVLTDDAGGLFAIDGDEVVLAAIPDIADGTSRSITVSARDSAGNATVQTFQLGVTDADGTPPDDLQISGQSIFENVDIGTEVGRFSAIDPEGGQVTYTLLETGGGRFAIDGNALVTAAPINFESAEDYTLTVRASDPTGSAVTVSFTVNVINDPADDAFPSSQGGGAPELIVGERGDDFFVLDTGADRTEPNAALNVLGGPGNDTVDGLTGTDTVIYGLRREDVIETVLTNNEVRVEVEGPEIDILRSIERMELEDGTYLYGLRAEVAETYRLYAAALARTPDEGGLLFWDGQSQAGATRREIAQAFVSSREFEANFLADPSDEAFIDALYFNVLGRAADAGGRAFWLDVFQTGDLGRAGMLIQFADSRENLANNEDNYDDGVWVL